MAKLAFGTRAGEGRPLQYTTATHALQISEDIMPIADVKAHLSEVVRSLEERGRPVIVTLNGKAAAVLMSPSDYDRVSYHVRVASKIQRGLADAAAGRTISDEELGRRVARRYRSTPKPRKRTSRAK
ncbi:MAG TPA: type II toxin-antitoxin system Phd/YefM family antitoxin [Kofleriaceae bacterium]|nr:type II toxin-antitoxin system Phd/YefM family antitoxin [Kofleriaceae bacterium]